MNILIEENRYLKNEMAAAAANHGLILDQQQHEQLEGEDDQQ